MDSRLPDPATYPYDTYRLTVIDDPLERKWDEASRLPPIHTGIPALAARSDSYFRKVQVGNSDGKRWFVWMPMEEV